jgi:hypothetical protein
MPLNPVDVIWRIERWIGYGNPQSPIWFIGQEDHCESEDEDHLRCRLQNRCADLRTYHEALARDLENMQRNEEAEQIREFFMQPDPNLQPTWRQLMRLYLVAMDGAGGLPQLNNQLDVDEQNEILKTFQRDQWGQIHGGQNYGFLSELGPLPAPGLRVWPKSYTNLGLLRNGQFNFDLTERDTYVRTVFPRRVRVLREAINAHKPRVVVCYGGGPHRKYFKMLRELQGQNINGANCNLRITWNRVIQHDNHLPTIILGVPAPAARVRGRGNGFWHQVGLCVGEIIQQH